MKKASKASRTNRKADFSNHEIAVLAAYLAGASYKYADTEDIAMEANKIAPGRFTWRKYKDQINIETVRKRLWDATKIEKGGYLLGSEKGGWLLTEEGTRFAVANAEQFESLGLARVRMSRTEGTWLARERVRMMSEAAYTKFAEGLAKRITATEAERFFRIDDYVVGDARKGKLERAKNAFAEDPDLGPAVSEIARLVRAK
jgi:hypothetical protein